MSTAHEHFSPAPPPPARQLRGGSLLPFPPGSAQARCFHGAMRGGGAAAAVAGLLAAAAAAAAKLALGPGGEAAGGWVRMEEIGAGKRLP